MYCRHFGFVLFFFRLFILPTVSLSSPYSLIMAICDGTQSETDGTDGSSEKASHDGFHLPTSRRSIQTTLNATTNYLAPDNHPSIARQLPGVHSVLVDRLSSPIVTAHAAQTKFDMDKPALPRRSQLSPVPPLSTTDSPSPSECESWSVPSTRPPSQAPSRAASMSGGVSGHKLVTPAVVTDPVPASKQPCTAGTQGQQDKPHVQAPPPPNNTNRQRSSSNAHSDKSLLSSLMFSAPKLSRKSSARSTGSSRKSDSDGERKSVGGESTASLTQKYGVCQKVAIGRGATSVVRLAHKWDRTEEKLYAVKVNEGCVRLSSTCSDHLGRNSGSGVRMNQRRNTSRS